MRARHVIAVASLAGAVLLVVGCGGTTEKSETRRAGGARAVVGGGIVVSSARAAQPGVAGVPAAALPGITVLGTAERKAKPDRALIALTVGSGSSFGDSGAGLALVEQDEIDPVVDALKSAGAENVSVDRFGGSPYGALGNAAAEIKLETRHPEDVEKLLEAAQEAVRKQTDYNVQSARVVFTATDCRRLEEDAWQGALADARRRAARLADLARVNLSRVLAVSEATTAPSLFGPASTGCQALRLQGVNVLPPRTVENSPQQVAVAVTLQVTYSVVPK